MLLFDILKNVLDEGALRARTVRFKFKNMLNQQNINERIYALNKIVSDGKGAKGCTNMMKCTRSIRRYYILDI